MSEPQKTDFPEMEQAAAEAGKAASETIASATMDIEVPRTAYTEDYASEIQRNMAAYRRMRWTAFLGVGVISAIYLLALLCVMWRLFGSEYLPAVIGATPKFDWHILVMIGVALVIFAAIPLSLVMALVRMISEQKPDGNGDIKIPATELAKVLVDALKNFVGK